MMYFNFLNLLSILLVLSGLEAQAPFTLPPVSNLDLFGRNRQSAQSNGPPVLFPRNRVNFGDQPTQNKTSTADSNEMEDTTDNLLFATAGLPINGLESETGGLKDILELSHESSPSTAIQSTSSTPSSTKLQSPIPSSTAIQTMPTENTQPTSTTTPSTETPTTTITTPITSPLKTAITIPTTTTMTSIATSPTTTTTTSTTTTTATSTFTHTTTTPTTTTTTPTSTSIPTTTSTTTTTTPTTSTSTPTTTTTTTTTSTTSTSTTTTTTTTTPTTSTFTTTTTTTITPTTSTSTTTPTTTTTSTTIPTTTSTTTFPCFRNCSNGHLTTDVHGQCYCECMPGYYSENCTLNQCQYMQQSKQPVCNDHGNCVFDPGAAPNMYGCNCTEGYIGIYCDSIDPCSKALRCLNQGECISAVINNTAKYKCNCTAGFKGRNCEIVDPCYFTHPCQAGEECIPLLNDTILKIEWHQNENITDISYVCCAENELCPPKSNDNIGTIFAIIFGILFAIILIGVLAYVWTRVKKANKLRGAYNPAKEEQWANTHLPNMVQLDNLNREEMLI